CPAQIGSKCVSPYFFATYLQWFCSVSPQKSNGSVVISPQKSAPAMFWPKNRIEKWVDNPESEDAKMNAAEQNDLKRRQTLLAEKPARNCRVCGGPAKRAFCSHSCRLIWKVLQTRSRRPLKSHHCVCAICHKVLRIGRPR